LVIKIIVGAILDFLKKIGSNLKLQNAHFWKTREKQCFLKREKYSFKKIKRLDFVEPNG